MSGLSRACLRLSACAALRGTTIAGQNVFDLRVEAVNFASFATPQPGQVAGFAHAGNTGNGALSLDPLTPALSGAQLGTYTVAFTSATAFAVADPGANPIGSGAVGTPFATQLAFTIAAGGTAFVSGDSFAITVEPQIAGAIAVHTEQDDGEALDQFAGPPFKQEVELVLEISMQAVGPVQSDGSFQLFTPATDDELEATLDLLETQAELALFRTLNNPLTQLFLKVAVFNRHKTSTRFVDPKAGDKLATRYVSYKVEIWDEEIPILDPTKTGLNRLPPTFAAVAAKWPAGPELEKAMAFAAALAGTALPAFLDANMTVPTPTNSAGVGTTPNAPRVDDWSLPQ